MKSLLVVLLMLVSLTLAFSAGNTKYFTRTAAPTSTVTVTYANSQSDTLVWSRELGVSGISFNAHFKDSCSITRVRVVRIIDGEQVAMVAGDTLTAFSAFVSAANVANPSVSVAANVTVDPFPDTYWFIVTYAASAQGVTNPTVVYELGRRYTTK
jgi:hypothetical protein